ncbi:hypothetical protein [Clostridium manihotivorum]|uniref:Lipoprotein n=1 Tax=Clostridium manihotivorum TaxID=2320868 RepID=A0A410DMP9_9CLOT|nr:hypothetical protein [Clostridium manihotivorum]QAA30360.1 hypothetical protein C1I91_00930 [Clostridium manihotivorum]
MKKILFLIIALLLFNISGCSNNGLNTIKKDASDKIQNISDKENKNVLMVKNGHPTDYPKSPYGTSFEKFFASPTWKYFKSDDGKDIVEFTGNCTYQNVEVKARMQFILDVKSGTFEAGALSFNDVPQSQLITAALLSKVFEESTSQKTTTTANENSNKTNNTNDTKEGFYGQWVISKLVTNSAVGSYSDDDINKIIGNTLIFSKDQSSSFGDDISDMNDTIRNPIYKSSVISNKDFQINYNIPFDKLGVKGTSITEITVLNSNNTCSCTFYIKDNDTLILYGGGSFFELHKK